MESVDLDKEKTKKPYTGPEFVVYGDIREIIKANDNVGGPDGPAGGNMDKT